MIRWSGGASIIGGVLFALFAVLHPPRDVHAVSELVWVGIHQIGVLAVIFLLLGLVGLYLVQAKPTGTLIFFGFIAAFAGTVLFMGGLFLDAYFFPDLATDAPQVVEGVLTGNLSGPPLIGLGLAAGGMAAGYLLFGFATWHADILPRWAALLLTVGMPVFAPGPLLPKIVQTIAAVIVGTAFIGLGLPLWRGKV